MSTDIFEQIVQARRAGQRAALATIVKSQGSTPRKDHAKMLIREDGTSVGSIGGGCVEAAVWEKAQEVMGNNRAELLKYELNDDDAENEGLICGGTVEIFVEPVLPDPRVVLLGGGHLGQAIARLGSQVGFQVVVVDDRESFASVERFPDAEVICQPFEAGLGALNLNSESFVLVITRGHRHDQIALERALQSPARYVGLIGSRRKIALLVKNLLTKGYEPGVFERLYAPIGLEIGSETPEEIAVSAVAELIAIRKGVHQRSEKQLFVIRLIQGERGRPSAAAQ
jgi:xanthine dehydrogenase accessory factor